MSGSQDVLGLLERLQSAGRLSSEEEAEYIRLRDMKVGRVDMVHSGANRRRFAVVKGDEDMPDTDIDPGVGSHVVATDDGGFVETDDPADLAKALTLPGPAKAAMTTKLTEASGRLSSLLAKVKGAATAPPGAPIPTDIGQEAKAIASLISTAASGSSPKPASPGGEEKPMAKEADPVAVDLDGENYTGSLVELAKAGKKMSGATKKKFKEHLSGLKTILDEAGDPSASMANAVTAVLGPVMKGFTDSMAEMQKSNVATQALLAKALGVETPGAQPAADKPAAEPDPQQPVAKDADPPPQPAVQPQPVAGGQAQPIAPTEPLAKAAGDDLWDKSNYLGDINADPDPDGNE
jgi:hypothetical protein